MILLPLFLTFVFLFSFISQDLLENYVDQSKNQKSFIGYKAAHRNLLNAEQRYLYKRSPKSIKSSEPIPPSPHPTLSKRQPSERKIIFSRFNIWELFQGKTKDAPEAIFLKKLILTTYQKEPWYIKNFEDYFLETIILKGKEQLKNFGWIHLEKMNFSDKKFQNCWYHILKGSFDHDFSKSIGYPSILEIVTIDPSIKKNNLPRARIEILATLFSSKIAQKIQDFEWSTNKFKAIKQVELENLLKSESFSYNPTLLHSLFSFEIHPPNGQAIYLSSKDDLTKISLSKKLYPSLSSKEETLK